jgi:hypothetical protein
MSRRGCSLPANASGVDPHRASISSRFGQVAAASGTTANVLQYALLLGFTPQVRGHRAAILSPSASQLARWWTRPLWCG